MLKLEKKKVYKNLNGVNACAIQIYWETNKVTVFLYDICNETEMNVLKEQWHCNIMYQWNNTVSLISLF